MKRNKIMLLTLLAGSVGLHSAPAMAQAATPAAEPAADPTIVVNGYVRSLELARDIKRKSDIGVDVIVAEDMAKFPELNLAESLQRLPGLAINREAGEGRRVSLRGLGPDFTRVQLNGMEVLGNVDSAMDSRGQRSRDRAFDFNIFASELFSRVEVEKTYQSAQNEGGMAGTVGLFTGRPFDYKPGTTGAINAKLGTNTYTKDAQPRVAALFAKNWDGVFGVLVSAAYSKRKTQEQGYDTYSSSQPSASKLAGYVTSGLDISALSSADQAKFLSGNSVFASGNRLSVWDANQERLGLTASAQFRPSDKLLLTLDGLHGQFTTHRDEYHLATRPGSTSGSVMFDTDSKIKAISWDSSNYVTSMSVDNLTYASEHRRELNKNAFNALELTGEWKPIDKLTVDGHIGYQHSSYTTPYDDKLYLRAKGGMTTTYAADGTSAGNVYTWDTTNPANYTFKEFYFRSFWNNSDLREGVLNAKYELNSAVKLRAGAAYHRYATAGSEVYNDGLFHNLTGSAVASYATVFTENKFGSWITGDFDKAFAAYNTQHTTAGATDVENNYRVAEATKSFYGQVDWNVDLGGMRLRGNVGLRGYFTDLHSEGQMSNGDDEAIGQANRKASYSGLLPAFNAVLEVNRNVQLRAAIAQNLNRPSLGSMRAGGSFDATSNSVSVGNPDLKPYKDTSFDVAAEWYFGKVGMVTVGAFYKDIKDLISTATYTNVTLNQLGISPSIVSGGSGSTVLSLVSQSVNIGKAYVAGVELAAQTTFSFLPAPFDKLGVSGNITLLDSDAPVNGVRAPIAGLSKANANATLYYETAKWGVRGSINHRSSYLRTVYDGKDPTTMDGFDGTDYIDAAAFYNITKGVRLSIDAINIGNEREVQFNSTYHRLHNETQSGTTVFFGLGVKF